LYSNTPTLSISFYYSSINILFLIKYSFIVGYRNREVTRIKFALDSLASQMFTSFELIFVDYGSSEDHANQVKELVSKYSFATYYYSDTRGWFWNRAHALNTGVKIAKGEILVFYDIDLIVEQDFIQKLIQLDFEKSFHTFSCFYLPEGFDLKNKNLSKDGIHYEQNYVGLCAVKKEHVFGIGGFDEYFMVWGAEDDDFYKRLSKSGIARIQNITQDFLVFHQYHKVDAPIKPSLWYLTMINYLHNDKERIHSSFDWGNLISSNDRVMLNSILLHDNLIDSYLINNGKSFLYFNTFMSEFYENKEKTGVFKFLENIEESKKGLFNIFNVNKLSNVQYLQKKDVREFLQYFIGTQRHLIADYSYRENHSEIIFWYLKKSSK